jgi:hypothetical protein
MYLEETEARNDCTGEGQQPLNRPTGRVKRYERGEGKEDVFSLHPCCVMGYIIVHNYIPIDRYLNLGQVTDMRT